MKVNYRGVAAAVVGLVACLSVLPTATSPAAAAEIGSASCTVPDDAPLRARGSAGPMDAYPHERWLAEGTAPRGIAGMASGLRAQFGTDTKQAPYTTLANGLIGSTVDHRTRQLVAVVDPSVPLASLHGRTRAMMAGAGAGSEVGFRVQAGCRSAALLLATMKALDARSWSPTAGSSTFYAAVDPMSSTVKVTFPERDAAAAQAAREAFGDSVTVSIGAVGRADRMTDGSPHYGGAAIGSYKDRFCSAGFSIVRSNGVRGGTTAGHCFTNGDPVYSYTAPWGTAGGEANFPAYDMMWVSSSTQKYTNVIHVDPCCPSTRTVTGRSNPAVNDLVCASGMVTKAVCGLRVTSLAGKLCDKDGCTYGLIEAVKANANVLNGGDSGGPIYTRPGSTTATIKGMIIGGVFGGDTVLGETVANVESHLSVTVATTPQT